MWVEYSDVGQTKLRNKTMVIAVPIKPERTMQKKLLERRITTSVN